MASLHFDLVIVLGICDKENKQDRCPESCEQGVYHLSTAKNCVNNLFTIDRELDTLTQRWAGQASRMYIYIY